MAADRTVVLVGRTGNGKSATGNSILGGVPKPFKSKLCAGGVTVTTERQMTKLSDGRIMSVIDTPGLFDFSGHDTEFLGKEIVKCMQLADEGIHAVLIVLSLRNRFSIEEKEAVRYILKFFGSKISEHMIVLITGGDELEANDQKIDDYLGSECPEPLKEIMEMCDNKYVVFDNRTDDKEKITDQRNRLLALIEEVLRNNGGKPYTHDLFEKKKDGVKFIENDAIRSADQSKWDEIEERQDKKLQIYIEMVEARFLETTRFFEKQLEEERSLRQTVERDAASAKKQADEEINKLRGENAFGECMGKFMQALEEASIEEKKKGCAIL